MIAFVFLLQSAIAAEPLDVYGVWATSNGKVHVEITADDTGIPRGDIIWYANFERDQAAEGVTDRLSEAAERLVGKTLLKSFEAGSSEKWRRGMIIDPRSDKFYRSSIYRESENILAVEGCLSFFCRKQEWTRVPEDQVVRIERVQTEQTTEGSE